MMQSCAHRCEAPKRRTHSLLRRDKPWGPPGHRHLEPSLATRHEWTGWAKTVGCLLRPPGHCAGRRMTPSGTTPSRTSRHRAIRSLRAKATIMVLRVPRAFSVRTWNHRPSSP